MKNLHKNLYKKIYKIRQVENKISEVYKDQEIRCPVHLSIGQEAIAAGICESLTKNDEIISTHRSHAHYLAKGGDLRKMIAEIYGKATGCTSGKGGSMHLIDKSVGFEGSSSIVGNSIPVAVGLGLSIKLQKTDQVSSVFFGDATAEEGVFFESINFAVLKELPVLFICENNFFSVCSPLSVRQPEGRNIFEMVRGLGIASEHADGNDCLEVYTRTNTAIENIRKGKGPYFIEFDTYRWREHCGPFFDNDLGYRTEKEFLLWKKKDPIVLIETYLLNDSIITEKQLQKMKESAQSEVDKAFDFAEESPFPDPKEALANLYAE